MLKNKYGSMDEVKEHIKDTLKQVLSEETINLLKKIRDIGHETDFPTDSYRYSKREAQDVYNTIINGKLHHEIGNNVKLLEKEFTKYHNTKYAIATNSGTSALELALKAINLHPGDEVIVPDYTFVATAQAVVNRGGIPIFADIDDTYTISPESIERNITKKTKAIIPVHIFGNVADMDQIMTIAKKHHLRVIEDACQAIGATYKGKKVGSIGDVGCFSFDTGKAISTGQGGMLITSNKKIYETSHITKEIGQLDINIGSDVITTGNNYAMTEMQAILARSGLNNLDSLNNQRIKMYQYFISKFDGEFLPIRWHRKLAQTKPSYSRLVFMIDFKKLEVNKQKFMKDMNKLGLPFKTFYPKPLHSYSLFSKKIDALTKNKYPFSLNKNINYKKVKNPFTEKFCEQQVGINISPYIRKRHINQLRHELRNYLLKKLKVD